MKITIWITRLTERKRNTKASSARLKILLTQICTWSTTYWPWQRRGRGRSIKRGDPTNYHGNTWDWSVGGFVTLWSHQDPDPRLMEDQQLIVPFQLRNMELLYYFLKGLMCNLRNKTRLNHSCKLWMSVAWMYVPCTNHEDTSFHSVAYHLYNSWWGCNYWRRFNLVNDNFSDTKTNVSQRPNGKLVFWLWLDR